MTDMKALTNCADCRKKIFKIYKDEFLREQYKIFDDVADTFGKCCTAAVLMAMVRRGRSKQYIQKLFDELVLVYDSSNVFGKDIRSDDVIKQLEEEYELDFDRIHIHIESEKQFLREAK